MTESSPREEGANLSQFELCAQDYAMSEYGKGTFAYNREGDAVVYDDSAVYPGVPDAESTSPASELIPARIVFLAGAVDLIIDRRRVCIPYAGQQYYLPSIIGAVRAAREALTRAVLEAPPTAKAMSLPALMRQVNWQDKNAHIKAASLGYLTDVVYRWWRQTLRIDDTRVIIRSEHYRLQVNPSLALTVEKPDED